MKLIDYIVEDIGTLSKLINLTEDELFCLKNTIYKWRTTRHFVSLMDKNNPLCPIRRQVIPSKEEITNSQNFGYLVLKENRQDKSIPDCIARQYKDRVAFLVSTTCASLCRYCFRKEAILNNELKLRLNLDEGIRWISENREIRDVLITGGDPLMLSNDKLHYIIDELNNVPHIEIIRIGTRIPVVLPDRIDVGFLEILKGYDKKPIWVNIQCNHPNEITESLKRIVSLFMIYGVNVGNQSVLLKGINDDVSTFRKLHQKLLTVRVRPYYVFQCEPAPGNDHFVVPLEEGCQLVNDSLLGHTTGMARPHYVLATKDGKIPCRELIK